MTFRKKIYLSLIVLFVSLFVFYVYFSSRFLRTGPTVEIYSPTPYSEVVPVPLVRGKILHSKEVYLNGKKILLNESGEFSEYTVVRPPTDQIEVRALNQFGKETISSITVSVSE
jgi:hypothetical protein